MQGPVGELVGQLKGEALLHVGANELLVMALPPLMRQVVKVSVINCSWSMPGDCSLNT